MHPYQGHKHTLARLLGTAESKNIEEGPAPLLLWLLLPLLPLLVAGQKLKNKSRKMPEEEGKRGHQKELAKSENTGKYFAQLLLLLVPIVSLCS